MQFNHRFINAKKKKRKKEKHEIEINDSFKKKI